MRAVLQSEISVVRVAVFAEMAWLERRPELGLLCRAARDDGNRITPATVQAALPGLSDAGARNVIAWCALLGLCDRHGGLTALGEDVAETDEAPVPEQGIYDLWLAQHPLFGARALAAERLASTRDGRFEMIKQLPFAPDLGTTFRSVVEPRERFVVRALPSANGQRHCMARVAATTCRLRWTLDFGAGREQWQLDGAIDATQGGHRPFRHEPETDGLDLWRLAETWGHGPLAAFGRWQAAEQRLAVAFDGLTDAEQDAFRKTLKLQRVDVPGKGSYDGVTLEGVPIGPATAPDAARWALANFVRDLSRRPAYRSRSEVRRTFADVVEDTPLEPSRPTLPAHDTLIDATWHRDRPELFWSLAAPVDLAPRAVAPEELGPLTIGAPAVAATSPAPTGAIRVPYRGDWSMRRLVDRLLDGHRPAKVLLCDRYVRGDGNLGALKLLVQAVRAVEATAAFEVWTGDEETDAAQIRALTGTAPRLYRDVFGRSAPHDRYFLVRPIGQSAFGWQMSNSPLDARPGAPGAGPDAPLRWRDLLAYRVADDVGPAMRQWLNGGAR